MYFVGPENNPPASAIISPFYDAIIFSDIADLLNEFGNNEVCKSKHITLYLHKLLI